jgi:hypothetical protein
MPDSFSASANGKNQLNTYAYDASGNLQNDQLGHTFNYDAENRPYSAGGVTYYYDGEGERVAKSTGKLYLFGTGSAPVVETQKHMARLPGSAEFCDPFAIRLLVSHCLRRTFMPSVVLHVVEFTFSGGFDSHTLPPC